MPGYLRTRRALAVVAIGATAAIALAACSSTSGTTPSASTTSTASASSGTALAAVATCSGSESNKTTFKLGTFLPLTGSLASLGPAAVSGSGQALSDIAKAGGVNGAAPCVMSTDSSDIDHTTIGQQNIRKLLAANVSAILGAESSSVTESVLKTVAAQSTVMFSPANTDDALTGASPWYFRDAPPNSVEGNALGQQVVQDGNSKVGILVFNDSYGTNLRNSIQKSIEGAGGTVTYGGKGKSQEFPSTETNFTSEVSAILATKPDAIIIDAFDQTAQILPALASAGWSMKKVYFVDGNLADYSKDFKKGTLTGAKGTLPGVVASSDFKKELLAVNPKLTEFSYSPESYDAVILIALAAEEAKSDAGTDIAAKLVDVSKTGTKCTTFEECDKLVKAGTDIDYDGVSGPVEFSDKGDPTEATIGIYQYGADNTYKFLEGKAGKL
jgi:neutral amino acid transport system substrate-binding protein